MSTGQPNKTIPSTAAVDALSLEQALLDADVAINRSHDLMLRLVELRAQLADERAQTLALRQQLDESRARYDEIVGNRAYRLAARVWQIRRAIGV